MPQGFNQVMAKRTAMCFFLIVMLFFVCVLRVASLAETESREAHANQNTYQLEVASVRKNIFDCNLRPLTGSESVIYATVPPTPRAIMALQSVLEGEALEDALERLEGGKPIVVEVPEWIDCAGVVCVEVQKHLTNETPARHIIGYLNGDGKGVSGLEAAYEEELATDEVVSVRYAMDGLHNLIPGIEPTLSGDTNLYHSGIATTIDINIQNAVDQAADKLGRGAVVVMEVGTGKIRAMASRPDFEVDNVAAALEADNSPLLNRALSAYNVGSAFKPCIAAAALEQGLYAKMQYTCTGSCLIGGQLFKCHNLHGHGQMDLKGALAQSCNTYFYTLAEKVGPDAIHQMAESLGFGQKRELAEGITVQPGNLTSLETLKRLPAAVANFAIGQGDLLLSPVALASLYEAIAGDGTYHLPTLIEGTVENGRITEAAKESAPTRVMSAETAAILREYLVGVVEDGLGRRAKPDEGGAGGKTATAQTGWTENGKEVEHAWFCGFFPAENPKYVAIVLAENADSGAENSAPVFKAIADAVWNMGY